MNQQQGMNGEATLFGRTRRGRVESDTPYNPNKRPLADSPPQPSSSNGGSLFANGGVGGNGGQQPGARTIYSNSKALGFGGPGAAANGALAGAGAGDQDSYGQGLYQGERTTGMGRQASQQDVGGGMGAQQQQEMQGGNGMDQPRKRLRRGGPSNEDGADEGPGSFTSGLQSRLDAVHVESGPPSTASSAYGGSAPASMAQTPSWSTQPSAPGPGTPQPPFAQPGSPALSAASTGAGSVPPQAAQDQGFLAFRSQAGANFPVEKVWSAWQQGGGDMMRALQLLVDAKPATPSGGAYGTAGSPSMAPQQLAQSQQQQQQQGYPPQQQGYPPQQQQQQQQQRPQIQTVMRPAPGPGQAPQGYPPQGMMRPNGAPQQTMGYAPQGGAPPPGYAAAPPQARPPPPSAMSGPTPTPGGGYSFPPAQVGTAGMTVAHVQHYVQLQEAYRRGQITPEEYKQLTQYIGVIQKTLAQQQQQQQQQQQPAAMRGVPVPGQPGRFYPPPGAQAGQYHPHAYSAQGVYAAAGPGGQPVMRVHPQHAAYQQAAAMHAQQQHAVAHGHGHHPGMQHHPGMAAAQAQMPKPKPVQVAKHAAPLTSGSILARQLQLAGGFTTKKKAKPKTVKGYGSDSDDDGGDYDSAGSGDEYGSKETPAQIARREQIAVEFFNDGTKEQLMELAGCNATQATLTMKLRPFTTANDFRTRTRKQKGVGNNMMDTYLEVISGMSEVDKVLNDCEQIGRELSSVMQIWASGAAASSTSEATRPGATMANEVGLDLVAISEETIATRVDTSQDPRVREAFRDYIRRQPAGVPENIKLKDYQMLGVNWLNLLYRRKTSCILADEMGLGKTAQVIALLAHLKATDGENSGPHLVIVPSSTLDNWMREFSVFAPDLNVQSYYGSQGERAEIRHDLRRMEDLDVVVTTYNIATGSPDDQKFLKKKMDFKVCVFDEGHQLKNSESKKYKDLMQVRADWRLLLTGTPLQNNLQELVSLLSFILPEQFRDANESLRAIFKVQGGSPTNLLSRERINRAKKMMTPFVLRRKKAQVLKDLPQKFERIEKCEMTPLQREVYDEAVQRSRRALSGLQEEELEELGDEDDDEGVDAAQGEEKPKAKKAPKKKTVAHTKMGTKANTTSSAHVLTDLRKASNHPMLFRRLYDEKKLRAMAKDCLREEEFLDRDKDLIFEDMEVMTDFELHRFCLGYRHLEKYCLTNDEWMSAGKIKKLQELLPKMRQDGDRVLIFSQFVQVLDILEVVLDTMGIKYLKLTGQTQVADRQGLVDAFNQNEDITVFLLSTRAGGLGLNLTAANTVIFYDCDYNPHNDKQAEDRAYRIGQTRDVNIIRLVTENSLDEAMLS
ncbi:hypothetical protein JCM10213_000072, partial [Rhodosporidiobolus nylandii]